MAYSQQYDNLAWQIAREVFGDSELAQVFYRMMKQESGFDSDVVEGRRASSAGAQGIAQFMPATAQEQGVDPLNPEEALRGGAAYLQKLIAYFGGAVAKGVAAYNAGAGRVENAVATGGPNWVSVLPGETQSYLEITGGETMANGSGVPGPYQPPGVWGGQPSGGAGEIPGLPTPTPENVEELIQRVQEHLRESPGDTEAQQYLGTLQYWHNFWRQEKRLPSQTDEESLSDYDIASKRAGTALNWTNVERINRELSGDTYDDMRQRMLDKIDQENWTAEHAITEFNAWMVAALEAGRRGEKVYDEQMERAAMTTPTEYYPGTEPGGARERFAAKYGVEYTSTPGIAVETLPNPEEMYSKWHQNMGISQQAPPTQGGWSGQGEPSGQGAPQGSGWNASQDFLRRMNLRQGAR